MFPLVVEYFLER